MAGSKELVLPEQQLVLDIKVDGHRGLKVPLGPTSMELDEKIHIEVWLELMRRLGNIDRASRWWIGDGMNHGEELFGEEFAQAADDPASRYDMVQRVTGLDPGTLANIRSVCGRVARSRRREELGFWIHAEVAPLEPDEQSKWLQRAIDENLTRDELRRAIREAAGDGGGAGSAPEPPPAEGVPISERIEQAARLVWSQAQRATDKTGYFVPPEPMAQLGSALGEAI
ncbi:MAG: hypothetical protein ACJ79H_21750 [Myxococcales bacterium]